jgi:hypothetical protein
MTMIERQHRNLAFVPTEILEAGPLKGSPATGPFIGRRPRRNYLVGHAAGFPRTGIVEFYNKLWLRLFRQVGPTIVRTRIKNMSRNGGLK